MHLKHFRKNKVFWWKKFETHLEMREYCITLLQIIFRKSTIEYKKMSCILMNLTYYIDITKYIAIVNSSIQINKQVFYIYYGIDIDEIMGNKDVIIFLNGRRKIEQTNLFSGDIIWIEMWTIPLEINIFCNVLHNFDNIDSRYYNIYIYLL